MSSVLIPPFDASSELIRSNPTNSPEIPLVPNEPCLDTSQVSVNTFLHMELACPVIDELYPYMHLLAKRSSSHIDSLHDQIVKGRSSILVTEKPALHLIWYYNTIFIKPIPHCLLNFSFWERYLHPSPNNETQQGKRTTYEASTLSPACRAALGFLRTYSFLIRHSSDFQLAQSLHLLPSHISYTSFQLFITPFRHLPDEAVTPRYHYGQIRLTRLNWAVRLLRPKALKKAFPLYYRTFYFQTAQLVERFGAPLLFLFACLTIVLSGMQVAVAAEEGGSTIVRVSWWFSLAVILFVVLLSCLGCVFLVGLFGRQLAFGIRANRKAGMQKLEI